MEDEKKCFGLLYSVKYLSKKNVLQMNITIIQNELKHFCVSFSLK